MHNCFPFVAVCRHTIPLAAVNMIQTGEKYGYASFLCSRKLYPAGVKFVYQDIACKYVKWLANVSRAARQQAAATEEQRVERDLLLHPPGAQHVLAEAHGRLHSVWCWVRGSQYVCLSACAHESRGPTEGPTGIYADPNLLAGSPQWLVDEGVWLYRRRASRAILQSRVS